MTLNWIDLFLLALILLATLQGWRRGFLLEFLDLAVWLASLWLAVRWYAPAARWLATQGAWAAEWNRPLGFLGVFIGAWIALRLLASVLFARVPPQAHRNAGNRLLGILPGFAHGAINAVVVAALLLVLPLPQALQEQARDSALNDRFAGYAERAETVLRPVFDDAIGVTMNLMTVRPQSTDTVRLPFTLRDTRPRPDLEAQMLDMMNRERVAAGLRPLQMDPELVPVARAYSTDMLARGYFSHYSPEGKSPFDRIRAGHVTFFYAGENLAFAPTVKFAHTGLMNSPGHRANILRPQFGRVGIGIMDAGVRGIMVTQNFRN